MKKRIFLVGLTTALMIGCDSSNELENQTSAAVDGESAPETQIVEVKADPQSEINAVKKHTIPASDIQAINELYENAKTTPDLLRTALKESAQFDSLDEGTKKSLQLVTLEQLNRSDDGTWTAYFTSEEAEYIIPLTEFSGSIIDGKKVQVVVNEKGEYFISNIG